MKFIRWTLTLALAVAGFAKVSLSATVSALDNQNATLSQIPTMTTVTVINYVTPLCFAQTINSLENGQSAQLGIPLVLVWGVDKESAPINDLTITEHIALYETKIAPCTISTNVTVTSTATNCGPKKCVEVVSTIVLLFTYETQTQNVVAATSSPSKASTKNINEFDMSDEFGSGLKCNCKIAELVMKYETIITSVVYLATYTPPVTLAVAPIEAVQQAKLNPVNNKQNPIHTEQPVTTGSTISASTSSSSAWFPDYTNGTIFEGPLDSKPVQAVIIGSAPTCHYVPDIFAPISNDDPKNYFPEGMLPLQHPAYLTNNGHPYQTNKFHGNLMLGDQNEMVWTFPYGFYWDKTEKYGFGIMHTNVKDRKFSDTDSNGAAFIYTNPVRNGELIFSANSIGSGKNVLYMDQMTEMSARVRVMATAESDDYIEFPLVKGMGFATAIYHGSLSARISSMYTITDFVKEEVVPSNSDLLLKYRVTLNSGTSWLLFVTRPKSSTFYLTTDGHDIVGSGSLDGVIIQAAVAPKDTKYDNFYYESAGYYVTTGSLEGSLSCDSVSHSIVYIGEGDCIAGKPIIFALPHHIDTLTSETTNGFTNIELDSTTKGAMTGFVTNTLSFTNKINTNIQFFPWRQGFGFQIKYTSEQLEAIRIAAVAELGGVNIAATIQKEGSLYFMGKVVDKYAYILMVVNDILQDDVLAKQLMDGMKIFFAQLAAGEIQYSLMYDTRYGGVTSTANNNGDLHADFGSGYYNDHHFHYGYHIHAAAILGYIDAKHGGTWAQDNKGWVNALVRDVANPSTEDEYFPVLRNFDWFHGHLFAKGLFASEDGKDEESSSEDYNFSYGMKLWGHVIGDKAMEARGDLMLSIQSHAMNLYFLYLDDNTVQPSDYIANKVSGTYFENKIDYTTYFGNNLEYIHGIQMLPITPASSLIRGQVFVKQEWSTILSSIVGGITDGWAGILRLNQALFDAESSYLFFNSLEFSLLYLDAGQSWTWSLAFSAAIANGPV